MAAPAPPTLLVSQLIASLCGTEFFAPKKPGVFRAKEGKEEGPDSSEPQGLEEASLSYLDGKHIGLLFWRDESPPCRRFTERLKSVYADLQAQGKLFEVVMLVSSVKMMKEWQANMPWSAVLCSAGQRAALTQRYQVSVIPTLVVLGPDGTLLTRNAREAILSGDAVESYPWTGYVDLEEIYSRRDSNRVIVALFVALFAAFAYGLTFLHWKLLALPPSEPSADASAWEAAGGGDGGAPGLRGREDNLFDQVEAAAWAGAEAVTEAVRQAVSGSDGEL